ncbi:unnamed protein product [Rotaria socialis]|nr:unnamed protein product [Rotaria socialis]
MRHYMAPLPFIEHVRAQRDLQTMKLIRRKLKKNQLLLRETDKGGNLYVAHVNEFEEKAIEYRMKTGAYEELSSSPIEEILSKVTRLLNDLHAKPNQISPQQYKKIIPSRLTVELAYMYYNPKAHKKVQGIPIGIILQLADLVLKEIAFVDGNKFYRQIIGGAMGSPFTLTLANIFMWKWEKDAICGAIGPHEIYGRYIDDIFFTFNDPKAKIEAVIKKANAFHPNIKLEANIGSCVSFLDLLINNKNGVLFTSVYHKPAAEPCVVPFISDHPRHVFSNIIQAALLRAVRYSSTLDIFEKERRSIRLMLLYNG